MTSICSVLLCRSLIILLQLTPFGKLLLLFMPQLKCYPLCEHFFLISSGKFKGSFFTLSQSLACTSLTILDASYISEPFPFHSLVQGLMCIFFSSFFIKKKKQFEYLLEYKVNKGVPLLNLVTEWTAIVLGNSWHSNDKYKRVVNLTQFFTMSSYSATMYEHCIMLCVALCIRLLSLHNNLWKGISFILPT